MKNFFVVTVLFMTIVFGIQAYSTPPAEELLLWFDAGAEDTLHLDGEFVNEWTSKAQGNYSALATGNQRPCWVSHKDTQLRAAIHFDGVDDVLRVDAFGQQVDTWTLVMVCAPFGPVKGGGLCSACPKDSHDYDPGFTVDLYQSSSCFDQISIEGAGRIGGQKDQMQRSFSCGGMHVVTVLRDREEVCLFVDGVAEDVRPVTPAATVMEELRIGARYYAGAERHYFHGEIAQLLFYGRVLTDTERKAVEKVLDVADEECKLGEVEAAREAERLREERLKNRMKPPRIIRSWSDIETFRKERQDIPALDALPVRTNIREAVTLGVQHLNSLYDRDKDDEPFFFANCMADGTGKMFHSVNIGIPHVVGRCLLGCMIAEMAVETPFPEEGLAILERYCERSFDNPDNLNSYYDPEKGNARLIEFHNMREGLYGLWALVAGRNSVWAREKAHAMLETLDRITDEEGCWSEKLLADAGMAERSLGVAIPNAARMIDPLLAYYDCTQDPLAMKLAGLYVHRGLAEMFLQDGRFAPMSKSSGHVHSITSSLSGIAAYAAATQDQEMLEMCCRIMDVGIPEYFSSWGWGDEVFPDHPADVISRGEINQTGDVIRTALILGNAGYNRYYEVAERYLRSMVLPTQHREAELRLFLKDKETPADDSERDVLKRTVGGFAMQLPNDRMRKGDWPLSTLDITSGAVHAMSECYRNLVNIQEGVCRVNLMFDCENDVIAIDSELPFYGCIRFTVRRKLDNLLINLPSWFEIKRCHITVNGKARPVHVQAGYIEMGALNAGDTGSVVFDIPCKEEKETVDGIEYTTTWVGNQLIEILPRGEVSPLSF